jgi:hypothetical protein
MSEALGWPDSARPGYPANSEREGAHVLDAGPDHTGKRRRIVALWAYGRWHVGADYSVLARDAAGWGWQYVGPCHTPAEVADLIEAALREEREACASVSVRVEVPAGAETWSPLAAWEEALIAFNKAFRAAIRARGDA